MNILDKKKDDWGGSMARESIKAISDTETGKPSATLDMNKWHRGIRVRARSIIGRITGSHRSSGAGSSADKAPDKEPPVSIGTSWTDSLSHMGMASIDRDAINYFIKTERQAKGMPESAYPEPEAVLRKFGMISSDGRVTQAAVLLFGKPNNEIDGSIVKIGEFSDEGELLREEIINLPVIMQPDAVTKALFEKYIPDTFEYAQVRRSVVNRYPHKAIREAVVNAIIHKQYESHEPVLIKVSANYVEIYNPGDLPKKWAAEDLVKKHHSVRRNKGMAAVFHEAGFSESWGKGIGMMLEACKKNGNPPPEFIVRHGGLEILFEANIIKQTQASQSDPQQSDALEESTYQEGVPAEGDIPVMKPRPERLSASETVVCKMIAENEKVTASEMSSLSGLSERHIYRIIKDLSERGIIRREGSKKKGSWKLNDRSSK